MVNIISPTAKSNISRIQSPEAPLASNTSLAAASSRGSRVSNLTGGGSGAGSTGGLNNPSGSSQSKSSKSFAQLIDMSHYTDAYKNYADKSKAAENTLDDYESKVATGDAPDNPSQFYSSYTEILSLNTLEEFYQQETLFWKSEQSFTSANPNKLTKGRAESYINLQDLEKRYEAALLAGNTIKAADLKGDINAAKHNLQASQTA